MAVIKYFVSNARDEYGRSYIPQVHVYSISRLYTLSVTIIKKVQASGVVVVSLWQFCFVLSKIIRTTLIKQLK